MNNNKKLLFGYQCLFYYDYYYYPVIVAVIVIAVVMATNREMAEEPGWAWSLPHIRLCCEANGKNSNNRHSRSLFYRC